MSVSQRQPSQAGGVCSGVHLIPSAQAVQVGYLRRGRYNKGKRVGKAIMLKEVRDPSAVPAIGQHLHSAPDMLLAPNRSCLERVPLHGSHMQLAPPAEACQNACAISSTGARADCLSHNFILRAWLPLATGCVRRCSKCVLQKLLECVSCLTALMLRGCAQGDKVKKGQVLGYIEQLGTFMPVQVPRTHGSPCAALLVALSLSSAPFTPSKLVKSELVPLAQAACKRSRERPRPALALVCRHFWWCVLGRYIAAPPT